MFVIYAGNKNNRRSDSNLKILFMNNLNKNSKDGKWCLDIKYQIS